MAVGAFIVDRRIRVAVIEVEIAKGLGEPQRWNRYSSVQNNPLRYTDPNGRDARDFFNALGPASAATGRDLLNFGKSLIHYDEVREASQGLQHGASE